MEEKPKTIRPKNSVFQSCYYCFSGDSQYLAEFDTRDIFYTCDKHRLEKHSSMIVEKISEKEFFPIK